MFTRQAGHAGGVAVNDRGVLHIRSPTGISLASRADALFVDLQAVGQDLSGGEAKPQHTKLLSYCHDLALVIFFGGREHPRHADGSLDSMMK
ncbi:hypothetical protein D3C85_1466460 [compost metagenome]